MQSEITHETGRRSSLRGEVPARHYEALRSLYTRAGCRVWVCDRAEVEHFEATDGWRGFVRRQGLDPEHARVMRIDDGRLMLVVPILPFARV